MLSKTSIFMFMSLLAFQALANSYTCDVNKNGYSHSLSAAAGDMKEQLEIVQSWIPASFKITPEYLQFKGNSHISVEGGDRSTNFRAPRRSGKYRVNYYVRINPYKGTGTIIMKGDGYKDMGPVFYTCTALGNSAIDSASPSNLVRSAFNELSICNKRYVQQFLKGQGLYSGSVDGAWGPGTAKGFQKARTLSAFKGLTLSQTFEKLKRNPVCNQN